MVDLAQRQFSQFDAMKAARKVLADYPDLRTSVQVSGQMGGSTNADVEFALVGPDMGRLIEYSEKIVAKLRRTPGLVDVDTTLALRKPELRVNVKRERASDLGVSIQTIASTLRALVGGQIVSDYKDEQSGEQYDVWLRARGTDRNEKRAVENLTIPSGKAGLVRLGNVADMREARGPAQIDRFSRQRKISIVGNVSGIPMNAAAEAFQRAFGELNAPPDYQIVASGRAKVQGESYGAFLIAFVFSLVFMYMILAAQFESFVHPITILLAVPLTIPFALISLIALGQPLTVYSLLGLFLLFGIVKKNGILQVDYTNVLRRRAAEDALLVGAMYRENGPVAADAGWFRRWVGRLPEERKVRLWAIMEANRVRLRPILMTTCMLIAGMIPIAMGVGPGSASRASMAKVIVGGQALSLLLSLLVTPVAYSLFDDLSLWFHRRVGRRATGEQKQAEEEAQPAEMARV
jgi:HAE1 family hydrophobic/amphiphilic exporter-1